MKKIRNFFKSLLILIGVLSPMFFLTSCGENITNFDSIEQIKLNQKEIVFGAPELTYCAEFAPEEFPDAKDIKIYKDIASAYEGLKRGKMDVFLQDASMARVEISKGISGLKIIDGEIGPKNSIGIGIAPKSKLSKSQLDDFITLLSENGTLDDMKYRWCSVKEYTMPSSIVLPTDLSLPVLKVATSGNVEPYSFYQSNSTLIGFDIELSMRIAEYFNMRLDFMENTSYPSLIASVQSNLADLLIANLYLTEERKTNFNCSIPYIDTYACCVVRNYEEKELSSLGDLANKKIGYEMASSHFHQVAEEKLSSPNLVAFNNTPDCLAALLYGRIDGFVCDLPVAKMAVHKQSNIKIIEEYLSSDLYGFPFKKGSSLRDEFNSEISKMKNDGTIDSLKDKWFSENPSKKKIFVQDDSKTYSRVVNITTTCTLEPMTYFDENGNPTGFDVDLVVMICEALNYKANIMPVNNITSAFSSLESGLSDTFANALCITEERMTTYDFSDPYYDGAVCVVVKKIESDEKSFFEKIGESFKKTFVIEERWKLILSGIWVTLLISVCSGIIGILFGFGLCMIRMHSAKPVKAISKWFIKLIQGAPIVVLLMIMYYLVFGQIDINAIIVAIVTYGINFGVYASEIMRSGFESVDKGQIEASLAIGYSVGQSFRKISLPQAAKRFIPVLRGEFISMVKMTSIAGYISVAELTRVGDIIRSKTMEAFFPLVAIALIYFGISELLTFGLSIIDKKLDYLNRNREVKGVTKDEK